MAAWLHSLVVGDSNLWVTYCAFPVFRANTYALSNYDLYYDFTVFLLLFVRVVHTSHDNFPR